MFRKNIYLFSILAIILAACSTITPTPQAVTPEVAMTEEAMIDEGMDDEAMAEEMMEDEAMGDESMADDEMGEDMKDETMMDEDEMGEEMMEDDAMREEDTQTTNFTVRIENLSPTYTFLSSGVFNTPSGSTEPGPLPPESAYEFKIDAAPGYHLSFATMFVQSNDLFYAPSENGIALFAEENTPVSGDVSDQVLLWDAGTEINQEPGVGMDQAPRQSGPNSGLDEGGVVQLAADDFSYPVVMEHLRVTIDNLSDTEFMVRIENVSDDPTMLIAPGVWVLHQNSNPLFDASMQDRGDGLEALAEDGNPTNLAQSLAPESGITVLIAPGVWAVHTEPGVLFTSGEVDRGSGLEALAEDGNPSALAAALAEHQGIDTFGIFTTPVGSSEPGPLGPGGIYEFKFAAGPGSYLSLATMFVQSNDLFYSTSEAGLALFDGGNALHGDISDQVFLWDVGTEINQKPGVGLDQAPRQAGADTGAEEMGVVQPVADGFSYPENIIRISIQPEG
jgi:hypothetical protein